MHTPVQDSRGSRLLIWFNFGLGTAALVPCCFFVHFPFLVDAFDRNTRWRFEGLPDDAKLSPIGILGVPFALMYLIQLLFIGFPAVTAAILLQRGQSRGLGVAVGVLISQWTLVVANATCLFADARFAFHSMGLIAAGALFATQVALCAGQATALWISWPAKTSAPSCVQIGPE